MFLLFAPLFGLVLLANLAPAGRPWRALTLVIAGIVDALVLLLGAGLAAGAGAVEGVANLPVGVDLRSAGLFMALTGVVGLALLIQRARERVYSAVRWRLDPENSVHTIALQLAVWAIGGNIASILLTRTASSEALAASMDAVPLSTLWEQGAALVLLAILGVGLGLRRGWRETLERLGLRGLSPLQWAALPGLVVVLVLVQAVVSVIWMSTDPASMARISDLAGSLLGEDAVSLAGAFTIGLSAGIGEELLMRGAVQPRFGIVFTTLLFAVLHTQYEFSLATVIVLLLGVVLGLVRHYFNTTACIVVHTGYNAVLVLGALAAQSMGMP